MDKPERLVIVLICCGHTIAVLDQRPLTFRIVVNVGHERRHSRRAAQVYVHLLKQVRLVEAVPGYATIGCGQGDRAIERVVSCAACEALALQRGRR